MSREDLPILYSFRRCPFAMRARMAIYYSRVACELREVVLRDKPVEMLAASPKGTVPVLIDVDGRVLDESFDIMLWALGKNDPDGWLSPDVGDLREAHELIETITGPFKTHLDRYKYATRYSEDEGDGGLSPLQHRDAAMTILSAFNGRLAGQNFLLGNRLSLADVATAPFVRQFANSDLEWFQDQPCPDLQRWLSEFVNSQLFLACMTKFDPWRGGKPGVRFPTR